MTEAIIQKSCSLLWSKLNFLTSTPLYFPHKPLAEKVAALREPTRRARVLAEPIASPMFRNAYQIIMDGLGASFSPGVPDRLEPDPDNSLARQIERAGVAPQEFLYDALCDAAERKEGPDFLSIYMGNYANGSLDEIHEMVDKLFKAEASWMPQFKAPKTRRKARAKARRKKK